MTSTVEPSGRRTSSDVNWMLERQAWRSIWAVTLPLMMLPVTTSSCCAVSGAAPWLFSADTGEAVKPGNAMANPSENATVTAAMSTALRPNRSFRLTRRSFARRLRSLFAAGPALDPV